MYLQTRFDAIGNAYESAHAKYPGCRLDHLWLLRHANLNDKSRVLEIHGGTGFLTEKILKIVTQGKMTVQDVSPVALKINEVKFKSRANVDYLLESDMDFPSLRNEEFDVILGLGGFHHIEDQVSFCKAMYQKLKRNGVACFGDFTDDSAMQRYFDEKVHSMSATGHIGLFASTSRFTNLARFAGFTQAKIERVKTPFCFKDEIAVGDFFQQVHGLHQDPRDTWRDIQSYFDVMELPQGLMVLIDYVYACYQKK